MARESIHKLYYSIGEVSKLTDLEQHVLRYWETEFEGLNPKKNRAGRRTYTRSDIDFILQIKRLLKEDMYTIEGARKVLANNDEKDQFSSHLRTELLELRSFLVDILKRVN